MKKDQALHLGAKQRRIRIVLAILALLAIPFVAMQFTAEVNWTVFDFLLAAVLLGGTGLVIEIIILTAKSPGWRWLLIGGALLLLVLFWIELAVGIFGSPFAGS